MEGGASTLALSGLGEGDLSIERSSYGCCSVRYCMIPKRVYAFIR